MGEVRKWKDSGTQIRLIQQPAYLVYDRNRRTFVQFIRRESSGPHDVAAATLARILSSHGARNVVLNACRSTFEEPGSAVNLPHARIQGGVDTVVAMAYNVTEIAAKLLCRVFYEQLLYH